jgi:hypothetical protein
MANERERGDEDPEPAGRIAAGARTAWPARRRCSTRLERRSELATRMYRGVLICDAFMRGLQRRS